MIDKIPFTLDKLLPAIVNIALLLGIIIAFVFLLKAVISLIKAIYLKGYLNRANIIVIAIFFIILSSIGVWTSTSGSCNSCHVMRSEGLIWKQSSHREVACVKCHRDPGAVSTLISKIRDFRMVVVTATSRYSKPIRSFVPDTRCIGCHRDILKKTIVSKNIKTRHKDFVGKVWKCVDCHIATAHGAAVPLQNPPIMTRCITCHDNKKASAKCSVCHTDDIQASVKFKKWDPWQRAHGDSWQKLHGITDRTVCVICHKASFCSKCHIQMPHPSRFTELHGNEAKNKDNQCLKCHSQNSCSNCHQTQLPHPKQFSVSHKKETTRLGKEFCSKCHTERSCNDCHAYHQDHPKKGGANKAVN